MNKNEFKRLLSERVLILDGAMGTELYRRGHLSDIGAPEELNLKYPKRLQEVYRDYLEAGSEFILTNSFGANRLKLAEYKLDGKLVEVNQSAVKIARETASKYSALVAADIGPIGCYLQPLGTVSFEEAYEIFSEQVRALAAAGPDVLVIETMAEIREVKAALLAAKDNFSGPVFVQMTFTADGSSVTGTDVLAFLSVAQSMGADVIGMNCSVGPAELAKLAKLLTGYTKLPISFKPNAGMPKLVNRETVFPGKAEAFVSASVEAYRSGVNLFGGCCGTTPAFIKALAKELKGKKPVQRSIRNSFLISSRIKALDLNSVKGIVKVGERINPTNRKSFQEELLRGNFGVLKKEAQGQVKSGALVLDLNLGIPGADEVAMMKRAAAEIQEVVQVPLCLDSSSLQALEAGLRSCAGKPIINSVNGDKDKLDAILPLAIRWGAALVGLCIDEKGLPKSAAERLKIAERIIAAAKKHGFPENEIIFDYLTLAVSAMPEGVKETLDAIRESKKRWPSNKTILGISNVSFGMPDRQLLNSTFLKLAADAGLDLAILNPHEQWDIDDREAKELLLNRDPNGANYIKKHGSAPKKNTAKAKTALPADQLLYNAVLEGSREEIRLLIRQVLETKKPALEIANDILLHALNEVGDKFKKKEYFLPQVILAAEAAQAAFAELKPLLQKDTSFRSGKIVLATVKGDVHDIGKNIVAAVLESHGWEVVDLGKNVEAEAIVKAAEKEKAPIIGLSALMTTTMLEMEKVIQINRARNSSIKIIVGGAPVTQKFASEIGADGYAKDAVEAAEVVKKLRP